MDFSESIKYLRALQLLNADAHTWKKFQPFLASLAETQKVSAETLDFTTSVNDL